MLNKEFEIIPPITLAQQQFVVSCFSNKSFVSHIGKMNKEDLTEFLIFVYNKEPVGVYAPFISNKTGLKIAYPSIFMNTSNPLITFRCMLIMVSSLFDDAKVDKISLMVYSNNARVTTMLKHSHFSFEGVFKSGVLMDRNIVDIGYYSMLSHEYETLYTKERV